MFEPKSLVEYWNSLVERCGVILDDGTVIEIPNTHENPADGFRFDKEEFKKHDKVVATWHTHPKGDVNVSIEDYRAFLKEPELFHYIVGCDTVWGFYVKDDRVMLYEEGDF